MLNFLKDFYLIFLKVILVSVAAFLVFYFSFGQYKKWIDGDGGGYAYSDTESFVDDGFCNVAVIPVAGTLGLSITDSTYDENGYPVSSISPNGDMDKIISKLEEVKNTDYIHAVILQIDSYGGSPIAPEIFYNYIEDFDKPIVSVIREAADSAAYAVAIGADHVVAANTSSVGSIGVNSSFVNTYEKAKKDGEEYISITTGKYKDSGVPEKKVSADDLEFLTEANNAHGEIFKNWVVKYRNLSYEKVSELATGRDWLGSQALALGLIDEVGGVKQALRFIEEKSDAQLEEGIAITCGTVAD